MPVTGVPILTFTFVKNSPESVSEMERASFEVLVVYACLYFLNKNDFGFCDIEHEVLVLIGEQILYYIISRNLVCGNDAYKEYNTAYIRIEVKLSCLERYIAGKNVIEDEYSLRSYFCHISRHSTA